MKHYVSASRDLVDEVVTSNDLQVSPKLQAHVVAVMADYFDKNLADIAISFEYMRTNINETRSMTYVELGNHCLMYTTLLKRKADKVGSVPYYSKIGASSYMNASMVEEAYGFKYMRDMLNLIFHKNLTNDIDDLLYESSNDSPFAKKQLSLLNIVKGPWNV